MRLTTHYYIIIANLFILSVNIFASPSVVEIEVNDDANHKVVLLKPATRIISLAPDITEILFAIGAGQAIIGTVEHSDYPVQAKKIPRIGSYSGIDLEKIITLKPDLIINWGNQFARQITALQQLHIPVYVTQPNALLDVAKNMQQFGVLTGYKEKGLLAANEYRDELKKIKQTYDANVPIKVFYQIGANAYFTINKSSWINQAIIYCGGENIFANTKLANAEIDLESIIAARPQIIVSDVRSGSAWRLRWQRFTVIPAVKNKQLYAIHPDWIERAGPRLLLGVQELCEYIQLARAHTQ